jgi:hypothetical protein
VKLTEKRADIQMIEVRRREIRTAAIEMRRNERDELGEVAFVRAHGMCRRVLVQSEVIEKLSELILH